MKITIKPLLFIGLLSTFLCHANPALESLLNSESRSAEDKEADTRRKPAEFMAFLDLQPGMQVLDVFSGGGYYTEIAAAMVGNKGKVDAHNNQAYVNYIGEEKLSARYLNNRLTNVARMTQEANELSLEKHKYDRVLLVLSFHDLFYVDEKNGWPAIDAPTFMAKIKQAMKTDGLIGIIDHNAKPGTEISSAQSLHRIDAKIIKQKMQEWGFSLVGESEHLRNSDDPLDVPMWDPKVRGKTDRVVYKFAVAG